MIGCWRDKKASQSIEEAKKNAERDGTRNAAAEVVDGSSVRTTKSAREDEHKNASNCASLVANVLGSFSEDLWAKDKGERGAKHPMRDARGTPSSSSDRLFSSLDDVEGAGPSRSSSCVPTSSPAVRDPSGGLVATGLVILEGGWMKSGGELGWGRVGKSLSEGRWRGDRRRSEWFFSASTIVFRPEKKKCDFVNKKKRHANDFIGGIRRGLKAELPAASQGSDALLHFVFASSSLSRPRRRSSTPSTSTPFHQSKRWSLALFLFRFPFFCCDAREIEEEMGIELL
jgi:hypothetical protein